MAPEKRIKSSELSKRSGENWVRRDELAQLILRGGNPHACAKTMSIDHKQLIRWIAANEPWACWIPRELGAGLDAYLKTLVPAPVDARKPPADNRAAADLVPAQPCDVALALAERPFCRDDELADVYLPRDVSNNPPIPAGAETEIACHVVLRCKAIGAKRWVGIKKAKVRLDLADDVARKPFGSDEETWTLDGVTFKREGGARFVEVEIQSTGTSPLSLSGLNRGGGKGPLSLLLAKYRDPRPDEKFEIRLVVSFPHGFVLGHEPKTSAAPSQPHPKPKFESMNNEKIVKHCALLAAGLAPNAETVEMAKESWCFKRA